ncbi:YwmB family TATA-box binding protein [Lihuaxuella thermophila]|uniref:TATA-box binding n=1 Tax=Lihuaxuella thermophila TaxID=1173111 RepID=A0A1H8B8Z4_9BACL|nr:YwmB family TATA-box binding protein [Lihuaxuella thermophila]SEM79415.1 TATA-box binding [Lihuaxuella thermophila]
MKKLQLVPVSWFVILSLLLTGSNLMPTTEHRLIQVFDSMGVKPEYFVLHHGGRTPERISRNRADAFVHQLADQLHLKSVRKEVRADGIRYSATGQIGRNITAELNVINDEPERQWIQPYISVQVKGRGKPGRELERTRNLLAHTLQSNAMIPHFHFSIQGSISSPPSRLEQPIVQAFQKLHAKEVESMRTTHTASISAYSPMLPGGLKTKGGWMNLQAAARVNHDAHRLIFTLGTPIITIEY